MGGTVGATAANGPALHTQATASAWPWQADLPSPPAAGVDRKAFPRLTIVTPSYNQAQFLEATIRSVLLQGYPNLEYLVMDGGSKDGSVEIIRRHAPWIAAWVSEPDRGQSHALNKGFARATGDVIGWINSDDLYCPGAFQTVMGLFRDNPALDVVYGAVHLIDEEGRPYHTYHATPFDPRYPLYCGLDIHQQALFWRRSLLEKVGAIDETLHFCMDRDLILRLIWNGRVQRVPAALGMFRLHPGAKTAQMQDVRLREVAMVQQRYRHYHKTMLPPGFWRRYLPWRRRLLLATLVSGKDVVRHLSRAGGAGA